MIFQPPEKRSAENIDDYPPEKSKYFPDHLKKLFLLRDEKIKCHLNLRAKYGINCMNCTVPLI